MTAIVTPQVALSSRSHEGAKAPLQDDRDVCLEPDADASVQDQTPLPPVVLVPNAEQSYLSHRPISRSCGPNRHGPHAVVDPMNKSEVP